jgi:hypothetical protein
VVIQFVLGFSHQIIQIDVIQFACIPMGILKIMDYRSVTKTILKLVDKSTVWESTIQIPIGNNGSCLDSSSAARGDLSVTPDGATKQPRFSWFLPW